MFTLKFTICILPTCEAQGIIYVDAYGRRKRILIVLHCFNLNVARLYQAARDFILRSFEMFKYHVPKAAIIFVRKKQEMSRRNDSTIIISRFHITMKDQRNDRLTYNTIISERQN